MQLAWLWKRTLRVAVLLIAFSSSVFFSPNDAHAVIGGQAASGSDAPWTVALIAAKLSGRPANGQYCGGTLVSPRTVITAGHCVSREVRSKTGGIFVARTRVLPRRPIGLIPVSRVVTHPRYLFLGDAQLFENDIAILLLSKSLPGPYLKPAQPSDRVLWQEAAQLNTFGWGARRGNSNSPLQLQKLQLAALPDAVCDAHHGRGYNPRLDLCGGVPEDISKIVCNGDSGGPLVGVTANGQALLVGISSRVVRDRSNGCRAPAVFTKVAAFSKWISSRPHMKKSPRRAVRKRRQR